MSLHVGSSLGPYTLTAALGHGGIGVVYTAQDPRLDRQVAIKVPSMSSAPTLIQRCSLGRTQSPVRRPSV